MAIGRTNAGGGGTSLNFKVVGGTTQPTSPKENTIWVNTDVAIPSWAFSATEPGGPAAGMVWISTGTSSTAEFNAIKKNDIQVYPSRANQYVGGQWVSVEAYIYKGGEWVQFSAEIAFICLDGDPCVSNGGNWAVMGMQNSPTDTGKAAPTVSWSDNDVTITQQSLMGGFWYKENKIDLTNVSTIRFSGNLSNALNREDFLALYVKTSLSGYSYENVAGSCLFGQSPGQIDRNIDVSSLTGEYYIGLFIFHNGGSVTVYKIELVY